MIVNHVSHKMSVYFFCLSLMLSVPCNWFLFYVKELDPLPLKNPSLQRLFCIVKYNTKKQNHLANKKSSASPPLFQEAALLKKKMDTTFFLSGIPHKKNLNLKRNNLALLYQTFLSDRFSFYSVFRPTYNKNKNDFTYFFQPFVRTFIKIIKNKLAHASEQRVRVVLSIQIRKPSNALIHRKIFLVIVSTLKASAFSRV